MKWKKTQLKQATRGRTGVWETASNHHRCLSPIIISASRPVCLIMEARRRRDAVQLVMEETEWDGEEKHSDTQIYINVFPNISSDTQQHPLHGFWKAWEGGLQSDYSSDLWTSRHPHLRRGQTDRSWESDPTGLQHAYMGGQKHSVWVENFSSDSQVLPKCCVREVKKQQVGGSQRDLWKLRFMSGPDRAILAGLGGSEEDEEWVSEEEFRELS